MAGHTFFLFLMDDRPAHALSKFVTFQPLHRDVSFILFIVIDLLVGGNAVQAIYSTSCCWGISNCIV